MSLNLLPNVALVGMCVGILAVADTAAFVRHPRLCIEAQQPLSACGTERFREARHRPRSGHHIAVISGQTSHCGRGQDAALGMSKSAMDCRERMGVVEEGVGNGIASRSMNSRRGILLLVATGMLHLGSGMQARAQDLADEDEEGEQGIMATPCAKECMPKCFTNFGAALVPGNRADVEVYCRSRCVFTCDRADGEDASGGDPLIMSRDRAGSGSKAQGEAGKRSKRYCNEGKKMTSGVEVGIYAGQGLEFYGCD